MYELLNFRVLLSRQDAHAAIPTLRGRVGLRLALKSADGETLLDVPLRLVEHFEHEDEDLHVGFALASFSSGDRLK